MTTLSKYTNGQLNIKYIKWILIMVHYPISSFKVNGGLANAHLFCKFQWLGYTTSMGFFLDKIFSMEVYPSLLLAWSLELRMLAIFALLLWRQGLMLCCFTHQVTGFVSVHPLLKGGLQTLVHRVEQQLCFAL